MDKATLSNYRSRKMRIEKLQEDIEELKSRDVSVVTGKVKSSMRSFPYIQCYTTVQMNEPVESERIMAAVRKKEEEIKRLEQMNQEVIDFINNIKDPVARNIFEYYYIDGTEKVTQEKVAESIGMERSNIAKIIVKYL